MYKVMFVCMGNVCRSPLAHILLDTYLQKNNLTDKISMESSGVNVFSEGQAMCDVLVETASARGLSIEHYSRRFVAKDGKEYDLILAMDSATMSRINTCLKGLHKVGSVKYFRDFDPIKDGSKEVPDPWSGDKVDADKVYNMIERTIKPLVDNIIKFLV